MVLFYLVLIIILLVLFLKIKFFIFLIKLIDFLIMDNLYLYIKIF